MPVQNTNAILANNTSEELDQYILVRTGVFHYLKFTDDEKEIFNSNEGLESKPNLVFYEENSETKVMLDYSGASDKDKTYLQILFKNLNDFSGLSFSNGTYLDEKNNIEKTFNLDLYFREFNNDILFAKTTTAISSADLQKVFDGNYFISTPSITSSGTWSDISSKTNSLLVSVNPKATSSFSSNYYIQNGDLVEIINPSSNNNNKRYEILEYTSINNKEVIKLKNKAANENLLGNSTIINLYAKTKRKERISNNLDKTTIGCCYAYNETKYYNNATEYECDVRTNSQYEFIAGTCESSLNYSVPIPRITVNTQVIETRKLPFVLFDSSLTETLYISIKNSKILINNQEYDIYGLSRGKVYKIVQDDESNLGYPLRISKNTPILDRQEINYYYDDVFGTTNPEGVGSEIYLKLTDTSLDNLYFLTENDINIKPVQLFIV